MKKTTILLALIGCSYASNAQVVIGQEGGLLTFRNNDTSKENITGSQYYNENFSIASVNNGPGEFQIRYNNFKDVMEYEQKPGEYLELIKDQNYIVAFRNGETYHYKKYNDSKGKALDGYLLLLGQDENVALYRNNKKELQEARKAQNSYAQDTPATYVDKRVEYFIEKDGKVIPIENKSREFQKAFPGKENEIKDFFKKNKINFENKSEVNKLLQFVKTL